jgi:hypothetical protein
MTLFGRGGIRFFYRILGIGLIVLCLIPFLVTVASAQSPCFTVIRKDNKTGEKIACITDKPAYSQGEDVLITVTNISDGDVFIINREFIDAGVATIERKDAKGDWRAIELLAAATVSISKTLEPCEVHVYVWKTIGYNRSDTVADPGTYRILIAHGSYTNQFEIQE